MVLQINLIEAYLSFKEIIDVVQNKLLSKLFETTNPSGASCLSRCLIYKVHTAHQRRAFILPHLFSFVKYFFEFFQILFALVSETSVFWKAVVSQRF